MAASKHQSEYDINSTPSWLNKEYFADVLIKEFNKFSIQDVNITKGTGKGDNFVAVLHRAQISFLNDDDEMKNSNLIIKSRPTIGLSVEITDGFNVFPKEIEMYEKIIPAFEDLLENINEETIFAPKCLKVNVHPEPTDIIVLDDMNSKNYCMIDRQKGLDLKHMEFVLEKLAKFHAASAVYYEQHGKYSKHFDEGLYSEKFRVMMDHMFDTNFIPMSNIVATWSPEFEGYANKMVCYLIF